MTHNYEDRKVGRFDAGWGFISTAYVTDASKPYETAVEHPEYNNGKMVIVETYDTTQEARAGHDRWVETMTSDPLPDRLVDQGLSGIAEMIDAVGGEEWRVRKREKVGSK
jgi:hypothetical protein